VFCGSGGSPGHQMSGMIEAINAICSTAKYIIKNMSRFGRLVAVEIAAKALHVFQWSLSSEIAELNIREQ
jgi:hypothetical protein